MYVGAMLVPPAYRRVTHLLESPATKARRLSRAGARQLRALQWRGWGGKAPVGRVPPQRTPLHTPPPHATPGRTARARGHCKDVSSAVADRWQRPGGLCLRSRP